MGVRLKGWLFTITLVASSAVFAGSAIAQEATDDAASRRLSQQPGVWEAFEDAYFRNDGTFYENRGIPGNLTWFLGPFPENNIASDGRAVDRVYRDAFTQQALSDPLIRTADLASPFDTSLLLLPTTPQASDIPPRDAGIQYIPAPAVNPPAPTGPVRALY